MGNYKSGFITVVGLPNVGKSTIINRLVGQKIAIISEKPQTTRNKIIAIRTTDKYQMIFVDTPGIHTPRNKLGEFMVETASGSINDADIAIFVTCAGCEVTEKEKEIISKIKASALPAILVINKIDIVKKEKLPRQIAELNGFYNFTATIPLSAKTGDGMDICLKEIENIMEEGPQFYPSDMVTDMQQRVYCAEIIREKLLKNLEKEVPHGVAVEVISYKEDKKLVKISANIYCEKESHKGIIIGKGGEMLKSIGAAAREDIEEAGRKKVFLQLWVKVKDDWRNSNYLMKSFGFSENM